MKKILLQLIVCCITTSCFSQTLPKTDTVSQGFQERAVSSFGRLPPLYIIDGIRDTAINIDISTIATIKILKDAEATAIYGAAGVGGVIIITTKKKKKEAKK